jgi:hypothetical protein
MKLYFKTYTASNLIMSRHCAATFKCVYVEIDASFIKARITIIKKVESEEQTLGLYLAFHSEKAFIRILET